MVVCKGKTNGNVKTGIRKKFNNHSKTPCKPNNIKALQRFFKIETLYTLIWINNNYKINMSKNQ